jgi:5'-3' exonuclease
MGMIPYKTILAIRAIAQSVLDMTLYNSLPVVVTGIEEMKKHFLKHLDVNAGVISNFEEDFYEKTCVEISERCKIMRPAVTDFYSARMKERLKRMLKSQKIVTDIEQIVKSVAEGKVVHLVLPTERKLWGKIDLEKGTVEVSKKAHNKNASVDILNELAEEVMRQGGKIQFLGPHYFPNDSQILAVLKGA